MTIPITTPGALLRALLAALVATAVVVLTGGLAAAGAEAAPPPDPPGTVRGDERIETERGYVEFLQHGEILKAKDKRLDGYGVRAWLDGGTYVDGRRSASPGGFEFLSATDRVADDDPESRNLSLEEGYEVRLKMCYTKDGVDVKCSDSQVAMA